LFSQHAANYQALAGQAAAFNDQFVQRLTTGAFSYASIEAALASFLQDLNVNADQVLNSLSLEARLALVRLIETPLISRILAVSVVAVFVAFVLAVYAAAALQQFLMTGQILSLSAFLSGLGMALFPNGFPSNGGFA
jgi:hypothetical protein